VVFVFVTAMLVTLGLAALVFGMVAVAFAGRGRVHAPKLAARLEHAGRHLNGDSVPKSLL